MHVVFYSPSSLINMNGHTLLSVILEHFPPWMIDESRKVWIKDEKFEIFTTFDSNS